MMAGCYLRMVPVHPALRAPICLTRSLRGSVLTALMDGPPMGRGQPVKTSVIMVIYSCPRFLRKMWLFVFLYFKLIPPQKEYIC